MSVPTTCCFSKQWCSQEEKFSCFLPIAPPPCQPRRLKGSSLQNSSFLPLAPQQQRTTAAFPVLLMPRIECLPFLPCANNTWDFKASPPSISQRSYFPRSEDTDSFSLVWCCIPRQPAAPWIPLSPRLIKLLDTHTCVVIHPKRSTYHRIQLSIGGKFVFLLFRHSCAKENLPLPRGPYHSCSRAASSLGTLAGFKFFLSFVSCFFKKSGRKNSGQLKSNVIYGLLPCKGKQEEESGWKATVPLRIVWATLCPPKSPLTFSKSSFQMFYDVFSNLPLPGCCSGRDYAARWRMTHGHWVLSKPILNSWSKKRPGNHWWQASCWEGRDDNSYLYQPFRKVLCFPLLNRCNLA